MSKVIWRKETKTILAGGIINVVGAIHESPDNKYSIRAIHELPLQYHQLIVKGGQYAG
jgi:hypothetical protein